MAEIRARTLAPDEGALVYRIGTRASFALFVPPAPGKPLGVELELPPGIASSLGQEAGPFGAPALAALVEELDALRTSGGPLRGVTGVATVGAAPARSVEESFARLAEVLLPAELREAVLRVPRVFLLPDASLHAVPFEALVLGEGAEGPRHWLDEGPVVRYGHSLAAGHPREERPETSAVLTVCDPAFEETIATASLRSAPLVRLPGTADESRAIRRAFPPDRVVVLEGATATESGVKRRAPGCRYLHLATHGVVERNRSALLAALVFAPPAESSPDDGYLHLFEIYELDLACDLAVLSACDTRVGPILGR